MARVYTDYDLAVIRRRQGEDIPLPAKPRKKRGNEESRIQKALIRWWAAAHKNFGVPEFLLFAIPNGGWRDPAGASILKDEGQRNGVSDLFLAVARGCNNGLFIEMKAPDGVASDAQREFIKAVHAQDYAGRFCYSYDEAVMAIEEYLAQ